MKKKQHLKTTKRKITINAKKTKEPFITFILLCDMPGHRMKSYGTTSIVEIFNKKLVDIQIDAIKEKFNKWEIVICGGFDCENLYKHLRETYKKINIRIVENQLFNNSNSCESLRICLNNIVNTKIFIIDGSLLFRKNIFDNIDLNKSFLMVEKKPSENLEIGLNINEQDLVEHVSFGAKNIWSEILYLAEEKHIECFRKLLSNIDYKNKFIFEAINDAIDLNCKFSYVKNPHTIKKINNIKTYKSIVR